MRHLRIEDYPELSTTMERAYGPLGKEVVWKKEQIEKLLQVFPEGQLCVEVGGKFAGLALSIIVDYRKYGDNHTYTEITGHYTFNTHDPDGDILYGIDVFVDPDLRAMRLGRRLYDARKELCENLNLRGIIIGGRIPGYIKYAKKMQPKEYIEKVARKEIYDPILTFQTSNGFHPKKILKSYLRDDFESQENAVLLEWSNIYYEPSEKLINNPRTVVKIGAIQWQMRPMISLQEFFDQAEFFIDAVAGYKADFCLFPEHFNAPLMTKFNEMPQAEAIRALAEYTPQIVEQFSKFAVEYNVNIIAGSIPQMEDDHLFNIAHLCRRDGTIDFHRKLHITPSEKQHWGMVGGNHLKTFETDSGRIGILVCYDVEFPELPRLMAKERTQILFVPFQTDTEHGYHRVRLCAQARAIENEMYVVIAGCVGNLPKVSNMDIQYAQTAVFSPADFAFPTSTVVAEATTNTEMVVIADVNLDLLHELHEIGSVNNLKDRRTDLYDVNWLLPPVISSATD